MKTIALTNRFIEELKAPLKIYKISDNMSWIELEITTTEVVNLKLNDNKNMYLHFMYNLKEPILIKSGRKLIPKKLSKFQSAITHDKKGFDTFLNLKANGTYQVCIIQLTKYNCAKEITPLFLQFEKVFNAMNDDHFFIHTGAPNLQLSEFVRKLLEIPKTKLSEKLMASGYINIMLSLELKQYLDSMNNPVADSSFLTHREIERIRNISKAIQNSPEMDYRIDDLCKEIGINASKLQFGFKEMHGKTVCNYISHVRLEKAEKLLKTTDLNVSQIVYSLGYSSRSYFCKIFKEKYMCTPKIYQSLLTSP